ncbi:MAG: RnfABCDGE type electron transport complex subunit D, partial [Deferribacterota bacterium]|nr:RnfABCDGE type electron transport complex subunit D [Deferribacterota bacterium]
MGLQSFLEKSRKHFEKGGKYHLLYPIFEMVDTFLYTPGETTKGFTHIRDGIEIKRIMTVVIIALIPCVIMGLYNTGLQTN